MLTTKKSGFTIFTACAMALILGGCSSTASLSSNYSSGSDSSYQSDSSSAASDSSGDSSYTSDSDSNSSTSSDSTDDSSSASDSGSGSSSSESDSSGVWLPDPGTLLNVDGEYYTTNTEENGITYDFYTYDFTATCSTVSNFYVTYGEALKDMGYTIEKLSTTYASEYRSMSYTKDGECAEIYIFLGGSSDGTPIDEDSILQWRVALAVPVTMSFTLGSAVPGTINGETKCVGCNGTGNCSGCGGTGRVNYGAGYETCVNCDGTGICNICDGAGLY